MDHKIQMTSFDFDHAIDDVSHELWLYSVVMGTIILYWRVTY